MSNSNTNLQTQSSNALHNAIMEAVDACPNACEMWKAIEKLKQEWQRFMTLVKQSQELKTVSYYKLYDILKQHQNKVNEIRTEILARTANPLALVAQQQPVYHHQNHPTQNTSIFLHQIATVYQKQRIAIVTSLLLTYDPETCYGYEMMKCQGKEIENSFNVAGARENVGTPVVQKSGIQCYNCKEYGHVSRECQKPKRVKDAAYHKEKMLLCKQEEAGVQLNAKQDDWKDDTDDEFEDQELEAHYMYMAQL
ncbi:retrovirus-related pol polyprotein from transposon TNT 1-94 [Tanacetum coccineum]|uniref:Retrovirus-related pol polyprotein from transposon TNT 1-94 n=1 Tax=Tanacetum coccineum TaxID=301880 RepID=A0ABQ5G8S3_9ASTR